MSDQALLELLDRIDDLELDEYLHLDDYKCIEIVKKQAKEIRTRMAASHNNILQINISEYNSFLSDKKHISSNPFLGDKEYIMISDLNDFLTNCGTIIEEKKEGN